MTITFENEELEVERAARAIAYKELRKDFERCVAGLTGSYPTPPGS